MPTGNFPKSKIYHSMWSITCEYFFSIDDGMSNDDECHFFFTKTQSNENSNEF